VTEVAVKTPFADVPTTRTKEPRLIAAREVGPIGPAYVVVLVRVIVCCWRQPSDDTTSVD
jgi:hypothetical protein